MDEMMAENASVNLADLRAQLEAARAEIDALQTALAKARVELHWKQSPAITPETQGTTQNEKTFASDNAPRRAWIKPR